MLGFGTNVRSNGNPLYDNQPLLNYSINSPIILLTLLPGMQLPIVKENYHRQVSRNCKWLYYVIT